jgi:hypothetical protein
VLIPIRPHPLFERRGDDITSPLIKVGEAMGGEVEGRPSTALCAPASRRNAGG